MTAAVIYLSESDNIRIMVKWKATTSAFDVAEVTKRSCLTELKIGAINIGKKELGKSSAE
ncbi:hypothetical protein CL673_03465 [Candidatus Bathyarchaeota archaeon]|jgi:DNA-binding protein|nr:hypothetical protein [Candidatus Bathyarchaeota archaeon]MDP7207671.1 hypothetical protein [Candidatus Bathyarchaeota archaeon]|tara:strand:+ start:1071 stop:1250 length:180 start_codon:yes stop_codon:yes gene_type:complete